MWSWSTVHPRGKGSEIRYRDDHWQYPSLGGKVAVVNSRTTPPHMLDVQPSAATNRFWGKAQILEVYPCHTFLYRLMRGNRHVCIQKDASVLATSTCVHMKCLSYTKSPTSFIWSLLKVLFEIPSMKVHHATIPSGAAPLSHSNKSKAPQQNQWNALSTAWRSALLGTARPMHQKQCKCRAQQHQGWATCNIYTVCVSKYLVCAAWIYQFRLYKNFWGRIIFKLKNHLA